MQPRKSGERSLMVTMESLISQVQMVHSKGTVAGILSHPPISGHLHHGIPPFQMSWSDTPVKKQEAGISPLYQGNLSPGQTTALCSLWGGKRKEIPLIRQQRATSRPQRAQAMRNKTTCGSVFYLFSCAMPGSQDSPCMIWKLQKIYDIGLYASAQIGSYVTQKLLLCTFNQSPQPTLVQLPLGKKKKKEDGLSWEMFEPTKLWFQFSGCNPKYWEVISALKSLRGWIFT